MRKIVFFILLCLMIIPGKGGAQNSIELNFLSGVKVFSPGSAYLQGQSYGIEAAYNMYRKDDRAAWIRKLRIRDVSVVGGYRSMANVSIRDSAGSEGFLGSVYTLSGRLNISLFKSGRTELLFITGLGATYSSTSLFKDGNPLVGSRFNISPQGGIKFRTPVYGSLSLIGGADIFHYSNMGLKVPNNGVNSLHVSVGLLKELEGPVRDVKEEKPYDPRGFIEAGADAGRRGSFRSTAGSWKSGFYLGYNYRVNEVISLKAATDAVYYYTTFDGSVETFQYKATSYDHWRTGISLGTDIWLGKLAVMANYGYYLKFNSFYPVKTYWTLGLKYYTNSWLGFQGRMYSHQAQADYAGLGLIFRVPLKSF